VTDTAANPLLTWACETDASITSWVDATILIVIIVAMAACVIAGIVTKRR
jgi:hypothetical protein